MLVTYEKDGLKHFAFLTGRRLYDCHALDSRLPQDAQTFIDNWEAYAPIAATVAEQFKKGGYPKLPGTPVEEAAQLEGILYDGLFKKTGK